MLHFEIYGGVIGFEFDGHLPFQSMGLGDAAEVKTIFFFHFI
jgi:hypothetical protein